MARIRTIKPEFPQSESIGSLSRDARLLFIQLWTLVDDDGRARASSRMLASLLYPYDDDAPGLIDGWMTELEKVGCIRRYVVGEHHYLDIPKWLEHQKIDHAKPSKHPAFSDVLAPNREASRKSAPDLDLGLDQGLEGEARATGRDGAPREPSKSLTKGGRLSEAWVPSERNIVDAVELGLPPSDVARESQRFRDYWISKPGRDGVKLDWDATWRSWVSRTCEQRGLSPPAGSNGAARPIVWITSDDPRWQAACDRHYAEKGVRPVPRSSKHDLGIGYHFPAPYVEEPN